MKTQYWVNIKVNGVNVRLQATINQAPFGEWQIEKLLFRGMVPGVAIFYTPSLLDEKALASATKQIEDQILADELESKINNRRVNLFCQSTKQGLN
jgi:methylaspartate ammonia-lyase